MGVGACVLGFSFVVQSAFIADADTVAVVVLAVGTDHVFRTSCFYGAIPADDIVVADTVGEATRSMPFVNLSGRAGLVGTYGRAVDDDESDAAHCVRLDDYLWHASGYTECGANSSKYRNKQLQDEFPGFFIHRHKYLN